MHELSICQSLLRQLEEIASTHNARKVIRVCLRIGPLSGIEPQLLAQAFPLVSAGTFAEGAMLQIDIAPVRVKCNQCSLESDATLSNLQCNYCRHWQTQLISGDELLLSQVELQ